MVHHADRTPELAMRAVALVSVFVLLVHELRYRLAPVGHAHGGAVDDHRYLGFGLAVTGLLVAIAAGAFLARVLRAERAPSGRVPPISRRWAWGTGVVLGAHCAHELIAGVLSPGHAAGVEGLLARGGWIAIPLALLAGLAAALLLRGADALIALAASRRRRARPVRSDARPLRPAAILFLARAATLRHLRGRAPPIPHGMATQVTR